MRSIKAQFFLCFAVLGALQPYLPVYLASQGLSNAQVGDVLSTSGLAVMLAPLAMTLLADTRFESRTLLMVAFACSGGLLALLLGMAHFWTILIVYALCCLALTPMMPLQDGLTFSVQQRQGLGRGLPYHRVRVWGTIGFIIPSLILYAWLSRGGAIDGVILAAAIICGLGLINGFRLPRLRSGAAATGEKRTGAAGLPTLAALRAIVEPHVLIFVIAMWLCQVAAGAYYAFYPLYLTHTIGIGQEWVGLIANLGVAIEIFFMLGFGWMQKKLGLRRLVILGALCVGLRYAALFLWPTPAVAVATQLVHGIWVTTLIVAPAIFLNQRAEAGYRSSIQGLYTMLVLGSGRIVGSILGGLVAEVSLVRTFGYASLLCVAAAGLLWLAFHEPQRVEVLSLES